MSLLHRKFSRRTLLRGFMHGTVASVGLPLLEAMLNTNGTAYADGTPLPVRFVVGFWGNGVKLDRWVPTATGQNYPLSPELLPFAPVRDYLSVVSGTQLMTGNPRGHHAGCAGILSGAPLLAMPLVDGPYNSTFSQPSIDQVAAQAIGGNSRFASLEVGISDQVSTGEGTTLQYLSHNGPNDPNPPEYAPTALYSRLFGVSLQPQHKSVLDVVMQDTADLRNRVGKHDAARLDEYFTGLRSMERTLAATGGQCTAPSNPQSDFPPIQGEEQFQQRSDAMWSLLTVAFACDQTRVASIQYSGATGSTVMWPTGATDTVHSLTHNEAGTQPTVSACVTFTMTQFSNLLQRLKAQTDGAGNLLDNTVVLLTSDVSEGQSHRIDDYPLLIAGGGGGRLKRGVHYRAAGDNSSTVLLSVLRAAGVPLTTFGTAGGAVTSGCSAIEV